MKKRQKLLSGVLSTAMLLSLVPSTVYADTVYKAGTYSGTSEVTDVDGDFDHYSLSLNVAVDQNGVITNITNPVGGSGYSSENDSYLNWAANGRSKKKVTYKGLLSQLKGRNVADLANAPTNDVDLVSGATCSSKAILGAVKDAARKAAATGAKAAALDKTSLKAAIANRGNAENPAPDKYTEESIKAYQDAVNAAVKNAQAALESAKTQDDLNVAETTLKQAVVAAKKLLKEKKAEEPGQGSETTEQQVQLLHPPL